MKLIGIAVSAMFAFSLAADLASAQCPNVNITTYGTTCNTGNMNGDLLVGYNAQSCTLAIDMSNANTCCNVIIKQQLLVIGFQPIALKDPNLDPGCLLQVLPAAIVVMPPLAFLGATVPPLPVAQSFFLQGVNNHFTTISCVPPLFECPDDYHTTNAVRVDVL